MRAIVVDRWTEPRDLGVREVPEPELGPGTLAVEVRAAGCNFFDILMVRGQYQVKPAFPFIPGAELAGVVRAVGSGVEGFAAGDRILASVPLGAFAERAAVPARGAWRWPAARAPTSPSTTGARTGWRRCARRPTGAARTSSTIRSGATCSTARSSASPGTDGSW